MRKKLLLLVSIGLVLGMISPIASAAPKAGAKCTKAGATAIAGGKKYTCVKSGKILVWNKGVSVKAATKPELNPVFKPVEPTPTPTPTATPTPTPTQEVQLPSEYSLCPVIGAKVTNSTGTMRCSWGGHANNTEEAKQRMTWRKFIITKSSTSQSSNYTSTPAENATCSNSGDTFDERGGKIE